MQLLKCTQSEHLMLKYVVVVVQAMYQYAHYGIRTSLLSLPRSFVVPICHISDVEISFAKQ